MQDFLIKGFKKKEINWKKKRMKKGDNMKTHKIPLISYKGKINKKKVVKKSSPSTFKKYLSRYDSGEMVQVHKFISLPLHSGQCTFGPQGGNIIARPLSYEKVSIYSTKNESK